MSRRHMERVDKILSNLGYTSRRHVGEYLQRYHVTIDGKRVTGGAQKSDPHSILIDNKKLDHPDGILIMLNKPAGYVCTHETNEGPRVYDLLPPQWINRNPLVSTIGRLDKDTTGLILITDKTELIHTLSSPSKHINKQYLATIDKPVDLSLITIFASGTMLLKGERNPCLPAKLEILDTTRVRVTLCEGKYHQVKRMFAAHGYTVTSLHRETFGDWTLGELSPGCWKECEL